MSNVLKLFLKIIHKRIYKKCEEYLSETQFGFRNGLGTRDALFCIPTSPSTTMYRYK